MENLNAEYLQQIGKEARTEEEDKRSRIWIDIKDTVMKYILDRCVEAAEGRRCHIVVDSFDITTIQKEIKIPLFNRPLKRIDVMHWITEIENELKGTGLSVDRKHYPYTISW